MHVFLILMYFLVSEAFLVVLCDFFEKGIFLKIF